MQQRMRTTLSLLVVVIVIGVGCPKVPVQGPTPAQAQVEVVPGATETQNPNEKPASDTDEASVDDQSAVPPAPTQNRRVWAYIHGVRREMDIDEARSYGMTVVDLSDDWAPYIFWSTSPGKGDHKANDYLDTYVDLANDRIDVDGVSLRPTEHNYHEVYGIPPSLSVVRRRFMDDQANPCFTSLDYSVFGQYFGPIRVNDPQSSEAARRRYQAARADFLRAEKAANVSGVEALAALPPYQKIAQSYQRELWTQQAIEQLKARLRCEGILRERSATLASHVIDWNTQNALKAFERKHNIFGWGLVFEDTAKAMGRNPLQNNFESLKRVLTERVISAAELLEDGSVTASYRGADGQTYQIENLVEKFSAALLHHLGLTDEHKALAFMQQYSETDLQSLMVAVPLPARPAYYSEHMDLSVVIDRGDVWYDLPFDAKGRPLAQPRQKLPTFTLYTTYNGQKIPLVRWRTTIGSWQPELRNGQEYYKYKISDVGPRIWKNIIAGPVWIPPPSTPSSDMVKVRPVRNQVERVVAQSAFGPGYASAYGLSAGFHITDTGFDNMVRTHGSVNYMSIKSGFSHGCHRLYNYAAVRLFSFVLRHRNFSRRGQTKIAFEFRFEHRGEEFQINQHTRGYYYQMEPPVPVNVLEGRIRGKLKAPVEEYVRKPSVVYQEDLIQHKAKTPTTAPRKQTPATGDSLRQEQTL